MVRNSPGEIDHLTQILVAGHLLETSQPGASPDTGEMNVTPSQVPDMRCNTQEDVQPLLDTHVPNITDQVGLAVFQGRVGGNGFESPRIGPIADNEDVF